VFARNIADTNALGGAAIAGAGAAVAAAAYVDAKFHITKDIGDMLRLRKYTKHFASESEFPFCSLAAWNTV